MNYQYTKPTLFLALLPILFLIIALFVNVRIYSDASLDGSNQIILMLSAAVASIVAIKLGYSLGKKFVRAS